MSWIVLLIFVGIIMIIIEVSTLILQATGLQKSVARFQAISLLTGTGFTTTEAEMITKHPVRRRLAAILIIFGVISFAIIITLFIAILTEDILFNQMVIGIMVIMLLFVLLKLPFVQRFFNRRLKGPLNEHLTLNEVYHIGEDEIVTKVVLSNRHQKLLKSLKALRLASEKDIHILTIERIEDKGNTVQTTFIKHPTGSTVLQAGDKLLLFGPKKTIHALFNEDAPR